MNRAKGMLGILEAHNCAIVEEWLGQLEQALIQQDSQSLNALFLSQSYWRDVLALTWNIQTLCGAETISEAISERSKDAGLSNIQVELVDMPPRQITRVGTETIEAFFIFKTRVGRGRGIVRLCPDSADGGRYKAWTFLTALEELVGYEETIGANRPTGKWTNKGCSLAKNIYSTLLLFGVTAADQFRKNHSRSNSNVERLNLFRAGYTHYLIASFFYARREAFLFVAQNQDTGKTYFNIIKRVVRVKVRTYHIYISGYEISKYRSKIRALIYGGYFHSTFCGSRGG